MEPKDDPTLRERCANIMQSATVPIQEKYKDVAQVLAECSMDLAKALGETSAEIGAFNKSTTELTKQIIRLNRLLLAASCIGVLGTLALAAIAIAQFCCG